MGDDAFLRSLDIELPNHFLYGDTMWLRGTVSDKYKERIGSETYFAVEIRIKRRKPVGRGGSRWQGCCLSAFPRPSRVVAHPAQRRLCTIRALISRQEL